MLNGKRRINNDCDYDEDEELLEKFMNALDPNEKLCDPKLSLFYKLLEQRHIWLDDYIKWMNCYFIVQYIQYLNEVEKDEENPRPIYLHIMSPGGEISTMFTMYDTIKNSRIPIYTINEGICYSAAFVIFLAGQKRFMNRDAIFIAHEGSGGVGGTYRESKAAMINYEKNVARLREIIAEETSLSLEEIDSHFSQESDWYIRQEEAAELGILKEN